ncbi:alpha-tocopherol transfer protein-like isoform X1 [Tachypleus tridentatus]|uniref:alpha-tocopherol transfer protein-like isoform X1 n=2 Tax=Tachypleus tridentatus TaxID=6853 RepID=UPI003FD13B5A
MNMSSSVNKLANQLSKKNKKKEKLRKKKQIVDDSDLTTDTEYEKHDEEILEPLQVELRKWTLSQPQFVNPRIDQPFLRRFLHYRNNSLQQAKEVLEKYFKVRTSFPHCYQRLDIKDPSLYDLMSNGYVFPLPDKDKDGRTVVFGIAGNLDPKRHSPSDLFRAFVITFETLLEDEDNQRKGFTYVFDQTDFSLAHFTFVGLRETQRLLSTGEKAMPIRHRKIHWFNMPTCLLFVYELFKSLIKDKFQKRMVVHWTLDSLQEHIPVKILPKEYGGQFTVRELAARWVEKLQERREHLLSLDHMLYDETKKPKEKKESSESIFSFIGRLTWMDAY